MKNQWNHRKISEISANGFTLIEVMVATAVLALGVTLIYEAFFISLDSFNYCVHYLDVSSLADEKIWQAQDNLGQSATLGGTGTQGEVMQRNKNFAWDLSYGLVDEIKDTYKLFRIDLVLSWKERNRKVSISRNAYALYEVK
ncbi:MAG: prepilin-type N-terminal cleavage/methylation domain-containing protein [Candidatus Omnitrophota bacterium]|nr:prepilin-type N-terminal cleavage/methylation domain-containing protein [Candidatus Omnitrophota bacterium]